MDVGEGEVNFVWAWKGMVDRGVGSGIFGRLFSKQGGEWRCVCWFSESLGVFRRPVYHHNPLIVTLTRLLALPRAVQAHSVPARCSVFTSGDVLLGDFSFWVGI